MAEHWTIAFPLKAPTNSRRSALRSMAWPTSCKPLGRRSWPGQAQLRAELVEAASYVQSLLPRPLGGQLSSQWRFVPSAQLGGDAFGHEWIDDDHMAIFLLDVCGHGVGSAMLSISVMNVLRSKTLPGVDFRDPGTVLAGLNAAFPRKRKATVSSRPGTVFIRRARVSSCMPAGDTRPRSSSIELTVKRPVSRSWRAGASSLASCQTRSFRSNATWWKGSESCTCSATASSKCRRPRAERRSPSGTLSHSLLKSHNQTPSALDATLTHVRTITNSDDFEDDVSIVEIVFGTDDDPSIRAEYLA